MLDYAILKNGQVVPADIMEWGDFVNGENNRVALTTLEGVKVSTVFLGINHGSPDHPLWFETMIFGGEHDEFQDRYATLEEALEGHRKAVSLVNV